MVRHTDSEQSELYSFNFKTMSLINSRKSSRDCSCRDKRTLKRNERQCLNHHLYNSAPRIWPRSRPSTNQLSITKITKTQPTMTDPSRASTSLCRRLTNQLNINDLELIMHWHSSTYRSVSRDSTVEGIWQKVVPQEAVQHPFLMHGLLALSSLDRACSSGGRVREERVRIAQQHQARAMGGLSAVRRLENGRSLSTCNAMFALACVMVYYDLALPLLTGPAEDRSALHEFCRVLERIRESIVVMAEVLDRVREGELCPLIREDEVRPKMPDTSRLAIQSLRRRNGILAARDTTHETDTYESTIQHLSAALERLAEGGEPTSIAIRWIWFIPSRFIELMRIREPFALVILAHFAVIMHSLRGHWWMGEWGNRVLEVIGQTLDAEWRQSISWVIDATGCYIPL